MTVFPFESSAVTLTELSLPAVAGSVKPETENFLAAGAALAVADFAVVENSVDANSSSFSLNFFVANPARNAMEQ